MDTSVTIIGVVLMALIAIPLYFVMKGQTINKKRLKTIMAGYQHYRFHITDRQHLKVFQLDSEKKAFLLVDFNYKPEITYFVNLADVKDVELDISADGPDNTITSLAFEFQRHDNGRKKRVSFYSAKHDANLMKLDEDFKLGQKWQKLLSDCLKF